MTDQATPKTPEFAARLIEELADVESKLGNVPRQAQWQDAAGVRSRAFEAGGKRESLERRSEALFQQICDGLENQGYGVTEIAASDDPNSRETVDAGHHTPRYILGAGASGERIREAPFKNHTDAELTLIESLVGRVPEFSGDYEAYDRPRRRTY